jgi:hypothetical protein
MPVSSSPRTIAPRLNGCVGTARGPRSRRSASRGPPTDASRTSSSDRGPTGAPISSWSPSRSCAGCAASSLRRAVISSGTAGSLARPASTATRCARSFSPTTRTRQVTLAARSRGRLTPRAQRHACASSRGPTSCAACSSTTCRSAPAGGAAASSPSSPTLRSPACCSPNSASPPNPVPSPRRALRPRPTSPSSQEARPATRDQSSPRPPPAKPRLNFLAANALPTLCPRPPHHHGRGRIIQDAKLLIVQQALGFVAVPGDFDSRRLHKFRSLSSPVAGTVTSCNEFLFGRSGSTRRSTSATTPCLWLSVHTYGFERAVVTTMDVQPTAKHVVIVEDCPPAARTWISFVVALEAELDAGLPILRLEPIVDVRSKRDHRELAELFRPEANKRLADEIQCIWIPQLGVSNAPRIDDQ